MTKQIRIKIIEAFLLLVGASIMTLALSYMTNETTTYLNIFISIIVGACIGYLINFTLKKYFKKSN